MRSEEYESVDACVVVGSGDERVTFMESLRGVLGVEHLGKISRVVLVQK